MAATTAVLAWGGGTAFLRSIKLYIKHEQNGSKKMSINDETNFLCQIVV
jgi:hypothetical protein